MSTDTELVAKHLRNARRIIDIAPRLVAQLEQIADHANDGYPTSTPMAPEQLGTGQRVYEGACTEIVERYGLPWVAGNLTLTRRPCGKARPCGEHDRGSRTYSTDAAALNPTHADKMRDQLVAQVDTITKALDSMATVTGTPLIRTGGDTLVRCNCRDRRDIGATAWADRLCQRIPDERCAGLSLECFARMNAWRTNDGQQPVERETEPMCKRCGTRAATVGRTDGLCNADRMADSRAKRPKVNA